MYRQDFGSKEFEKYIAWDIHRIWNTWSSLRLGRQQELYSSVAIRRL